MSVDEEYLQKLLRTVSHDMGGTLRVAVGFSKLILESYSHQLDEKVLHWLSLIQSDGEATQEKLVALSRYARLYDISDEVDVCNIYEACHKAVGLSSLDELYPNFTITIEALPVAKGYERLWVDLFAELIRNSARNSSGVSDVHCRIYSQEDEGETTIIVEDDGVVLTQKQIDMAMMPFRVIDGIPSGVGMGLSVVKRIAELQNGHFSMESVPDNQPGVKAVVTLPSLVVLDPNS